MSHGGPCHQRGCEAICFTVDPRLKRSAGLFLVGQCLHRTGLVNCRITSTLFCMKGFSFCVEFFIQHKVISLSLQQLSSSTLIPILFLANAISLAAVNAAISSSRGRVTCFRGATLAFANTKFTVLFPSLSIATR
ncbi:hypothetical protein T09_13389 [Trichinella sp. T9]|nr:hypothetical protein T09_13389 [Trichinella sp. T9]